MAQRRIFYSWQSDLPRGTNRTFIETCLGKAIKELNVTKPQLDPCLDRDTTNRSGSPDIAATILDKIDNCQVFVCDLSIVHVGQRAFPNPNVLFELGYAVKRLGWDRIICIVNEHFGKVESLPFDIRQRRVKCYTLSPDTADRSEITKALTRELGREIEFALTQSQEEGEKLQLQFGDIDTKTPQGRSLSHAGTYYSYDYDSLPNYSFKDDRPPPGGAIVHVGQPNRDYHRDLAEYIQHSCMVAEVGFVIFNGNHKAINDLTLKITFPKVHGLVVLEDEPSRPQKSATEKAITSMRPLSHFNRPGQVSVEELPDRYELRVEFGKVQPEANAWSDPVLIGAAESCAFEVEAAVYGDELSAPKRLKLDLEFTMTEVPLEDIPKKEWLRLFEDD